jgi:hypothetical protein
MTLREITSLSTNDQTERAGANRTAHGRCGRDRRDSELARLASIRAEVTGESVERAREVLAGAGRTRATECAPLDEAQGSRHGSEVHVVRLFPVGEQP